MNTITRNNIDKMYQHQKESIRKQLLEQRVRLADWQEQGWFVTVLIDNLLVQCWATDH